MIIASTRVGRPMAQWRTPVVCSALAVLLGGLSATTVAAQRVSAGVGYAFAGYAEQGSSLHFAGGGVAGEVTSHWRRWSLHLGASRLAMEPRSDATTAEPFDVTQLDLRLRMRATRLFSVEAGFMDRDIEPLHAAQSVSAFRLGAAMALPLAVGSDLGVRASYLGGSRFSGGGSAPFGVELGLGVSYAPWSERVRMTGDLEFQRLDRRTEIEGQRMSAPMQSVVARIGVGVVY